jgi:uncharacterized protein YprB with RNaseH-like and TPR domain
VRVAYLDIETNYAGGYSDQQMFEDYANHLITVLGVRILDRESDEFSQLVDANVSRQNVLDVLRGVEKIVTYNGRSIPDNVKGRIGFDFPVIAARIGIVLDREFPHTDLVPECWKRNLYGGQKKIEETFGLTRSLPGKGGAWATETWREYQKTGIRKYLDELLLYNKEDIFMLREIELRIGM